jgi:hypothetical protein
MKRLIIPSIFVPIALMLLIGISTAARIRSVAPSVSRRPRTSQVSKTCEVCPPYTLDSGLWGDVSIANYDIFLPLVKK